MFLLVLSRIGQAHERWGKYLSQIDTPYRFYNSRALGGLIALSNGSRERRPPLMSWTFATQKLFSFKDIGSRWEKAEHFERGSSYAGPVPLESRQIYPAKTLADGEDCGGGILWGELQSIGRTMEY